MRTSDEAGDGRGTRSWVRESFTPLNAAAAWAAAVTGGALWSPLADISTKLALVGQVLVLTLALHALHEAGHLVAGLLVGLPFREVTLGLFTVRREERDGRWRLVWDVNRSWRRFAGCVEREVSPAPGLRESLTVTALGGPAASIVGGALLLLLPQPFPGLGYVSLLIGALNALPVAVFGQASDGMIVLRLWSPRPAHVAWRRQFCDECAVGRRWTSKPDVRRGRAVSPRRGRPRAAGCSGCRARGRQRARGTPTASRRRPRAPARAGCSPR